MADGVSIKVKVDKAVTNWVLTAPRVLQNAVKASATAIGEHAASRAVPNAPIRPAPFGGALRASIRPEVRTAADGVEVKIVADEPYALRMHEELTPVGPLQLGTRSRAQPPTPEGGVGGRYISRVVEYYVQTYQRKLTADVEKALGKNAAEARIKVSVRAIPGTQPRPTP